MWACAAIFHQLAALKGMTKPPGFLLVVAAFVLIARPRSIPCMAVLMLLQIWEAWTHLPGSNHWLFTALVNVTFLLTLVVIWLRERKSGPLDSRSIFVAAAPAVRLMVQIFYFYVVFHKLNSDYLYELWSCGAELWRTQVTRFPFLPIGPFFEALSIYFALIAEALIPVLLAIRPTRHLGMAFGAWFHFVVSMNPSNLFFNFTSMLFAIFALYAMEDFVSIWNRMSRPITQQVAEAIAPVREVFAQPIVHRALLGIFGVVILASGAYLLQLSTEDRQAASELVHSIALPVSLTTWIVYALPLVALFSLLALEPVSKRPTSAFHLPYKSLLVVPLLTFLNGASPYLGLKTKTTFAMYSNLVTIDVHYNHLIVPPSFQIAGYQYDLVEILDSSAPSLQRLQRDYLRITWFEFVHLTSEVPEASVTYRRTGVEHRVERIGDDPALSRPHPYVLGKILHFHLSDRRPQSTCKRAREFP